MTQNLHLNAKLHKLPQCPECSAPASEPCVGERGQLRDPHNIRARLAAGEVVIKERKAKKPPRQLERAQAARESLMRAVDNAVDQVRRTWGINTAARSKR